VRLSAAPAEFTIAFPPNCYPAKNETKMTGLSSKAPKWIAIVYLPLGMVLFSQCATPKKTHPVGSVEVRTKTGLVLGIADDASAGITSFKGIPYAAPPVGHLRWKAPQPASPWTETRTANTFGKACVQPAASFAVLNVGEQSEDCLYLNIWSPTSAFTNHGAKPVLFFIHGGSFSSGAGHIYPGAKLAQQDMVVVTFNYRLGTLGFATHRQLRGNSTDDFNGNYGLLDQAMALTWVKENISKFGGDPGKITIQGQSAGASSVAMLMTAPSTRPLIHGAIMQSGYAPDMAQSSDDDDKAGDGFALQMGCTNAQDALECLRAVPAERMIELKDNLSFSPVLDGKFIVENPSSVFSRGGEAQVPLMISQTKDEAFIFTRRSPVKAVAAYKAYLGKRYGTRANEVFAAFPANTDSDVRTALGRLVTASSYTAPIRRFHKVLLTSHTSPVFQIYFARLAENTKNYGLEVFHGIDLFYLFNWTHGQKGFDSVDQSVEDGLQASYGAFVKNGNPNNELITKLQGTQSNKLTLNWQAIRHDQLNYVEFGDTIQVGSDICAKSNAACDLLDSLSH
jgi:para-nitrobenzyl esterase